MTDEPLIRPGLVVDPTDENKAILPDGELGYAVRFIPGPLDGPITRADLESGQIIGYGKLDRLKAFSDEIEEDDR